MARFIALLLIGPWLAVLAWLYWLYVRRSNGIPRSDAFILLAAFAAAILGTAIGWQAAFGHAGPIWKQVAAALGAYAGFNVVLLAGLLRHRLLRRRSTRERASTSQPST